LGDAIPIAADRETERDSPKRPLHFRKDFVIGGNITSARLYITALGVYGAEINCQRVGDFLLASGWQPYNHRHVYDTYDVTEPVSSGANTIGVLVGEAWYADRLGFSGGTRDIYGDTLGVQALLVATTDDE
jgi:alpha-L-rhamnosidase